MSNLEQKRRSVEALCREVGAFIWKERFQVKESDVAIKDLNSLVSYVDVEAEKMLVEGLRQIEPNAGFIAEEGSGRENKDGLNWIIDPLDGTTNFLFGLPLFAISIALVQGREGLIGVVYELGQREMFSAHQSGGATLNGQPIQVRQNADLKKSLLATGFPYYDFGRMDQFQDLMRYCFENTRGLRRFGSAATDLAYVACGRFDAYFEYGLSPWDVAGGALLVQEAGGLVHDFSGGTDFLFGREILASSTDLYPEFSKLIREKMA